MVEHFICQTPSSILRDKQATSLAFLLSSATDGRVTVWSLEPYITGWIQFMTAVSNTPQGDSTASKEPLATAETNLAASSSDSPIVVFQAHQSGINDIAISSHGKLWNCVLVIKSYSNGQYISFGHCMLCYLICAWFSDDFGAVDEGCYTIATVGDDNAVVVTLCKLVCLDHSSPILAVEHQFSEPSAHSSSITGIISRRSCTVLFVPCTYSVAYMRQNLDYSLQVVGIYMWMHCSVSSFS